MLENQLHLASAVVILLAALVPIYLTIRLHGNARKLAAILSIFILVHSTYHILGFFGFTFLAEWIFEPMSVAVLIFFGIIYSGLVRPKNIATTKTMAISLIPGTIPIYPDITTTLLLSAAFGIFTWLAVLSKNIRTFQFQISIFILIWIISEVVGILLDNGIITLSYSQQDVGLEIHVVSMVFLSIMLWVRYYYSKRGGKSMIENVAN